MSQDTLKKLVGALAVVAVLWIAATLLAGPGAGPDASAELLRFADGVRATDSIDSVRIEGPGQEAVELVPADGGWSVNGMPTDSFTVASFLSVLTTLEVGDLVARNVANHARMGVADTASHILRVKVGAYAGTIVVGDQGSRYGTTYVRVPGEDGVYLVDGDLGSHVRRAVDDWRSKRVVAVDSASVHRLEVRRGEERYALTRADSAWVFEDGSEADAPTVRSLLGELRNLRASGFLQEGDSLASLPSDASVSALSGTGATLARIELGAGEGDRWTRAEGDPVTYLLSSYRADRVAPPLARMRGGG